MLSCGGVKQPVKQRLRQAQPGEARLELPTIMDRALAAQHGSEYVQLVAFAIDVDRVFVEEPAEDALAFGWEVFLTEAYLVARLDPQDPAQRILLEDTCLAIMEQAPEEQGYGSQLLFAAYDAIERAAFPEALRAMFKSWHKKPKQLTKSLEALWRAPATPLAACARHCLLTSLDPKLAPPTRLALEQMRDGLWPLGAQ
jgi:hypothetical protein